MSGKCANLATLKFSIAANRCHCRPGIETVRRDNCLLVKNVVNECLQKILIERDTQGAVQYVKNTIADLLMNRMDLSLLVITKVESTADCCFSAIQLEGSYSF